MAAVLSRSRRVLAHPRMDAAYLLVSFVAFQGASYAVQLFAANRLGTSEFGQIRIIETILQLGMVVGLLGQPSAVTTFVAMSGSDQERRYSLFNAIAVSVAVSLFVSLTLCIAYGVFSGDGVASDYLRWMVWLIPFSSITRTSIAYFQGRSLIKRVAAFNLGTAIGSTALIVVLIETMGFRGWAIGRFIGEALFAVVLIVALGKQLVGWPRLQLRRHVWYGATAMLAFLVDRMLTVGDTLYLDRYLDSPDKKAEIGVFGIALIAYTGLLLVQGAIAGSAWPYMAQAAHDPPEAWRRARRVGARSLVAMAVVGVIALAAMPLVVSTLLGDEYQEANHLFRILSPGLLLYAIAGTLGTFALAMSLPRVSLITNAVTVGVQFFVSWALIVKLGTPGAAWSVLIATGVRVVLFSWLLRRWLRG